MKRKLAKGWSPNLNDVVKWPTPTVSGLWNRKGVSANSGDGLVTAIKQWGTPTASAAKGTGAPGTQSHQHDLKKGNLRAQDLSAQNDGQLNPDWEEALMGYPIGWTRLDGPPLKDWRNMIGNLIKLPHRQRIALPALRDSASPLSLRSSIRLRLRSTSGLRKEIISRI